MYWLFCSLTPEQASIEDVNKILEMRDESEKLPDDTLYCVFRSLQEESATIDDVTEILRMSNLDLSEKIKDKITRVLNISSNDVNNLITNLKKERKSLALRIGLLIGGVILGVVAFVWAFTLGLQPAAIGLVGMSAKLLLAAKCVAGAVGASCLIGGSIGIFKSPKKAIKDYEELLQDIKTEPNPSQTKESTESLLNKGQKKDQTEDLEIPPLKQSEQSSIINR